MLYTSNVYNKVLHTLNIYSVDLCHQVKWMDGCTELTKPSLWKKDMLMNYTSLILQH